jgi:hypothetical protein
MLKEHHPDEGGGEKGEGPEDFRDDAHAGKEGGLYGKTGRNVQHAFQTGEMRVEGSVAGNTILTI